MLPRWKNVPSAIFMQTCATITKKCIFSYSSVNITDNGTIVAYYSAKTHIDQFWAEAGQNM